MIAKQPNGLYCRFSPVVDTVTDWNQTEEEIIELYAETGRQAAREILKTRVHKFDDVKKFFRPTNNTIEEFNEILAEMGDTEGLSSEQMDDLREYMEIPFY